MTRVFLLAALLSALEIVQGQTVSPKQGFPVFDATLFTQKPDLTQYGLKGITVAYPSSMWDGNKVLNPTSLPDRSRVKMLVQLASQSTRITVIDIEQWPLLGDPATVAESIKRYQTVIGWFKTPVPTLTVGLYGVLPIRDYWRAIRGSSSPGYAAWQKENDSLASIAPLVDALFPSIYTFYEDRNGWEKYAIAQIREARRFADGKPVYVFLWPQYHPSNKNLGGTFLPGDYWRMELDTAHKYADGIVIWCCPDRQKWDDKAPWWTETQSFLKEVGSSQR